MRSGGHADEVWQREVRETRTRRCGEKVIEERIGRCVREQREVRGRARRGGVLGGQVERAVEHELRGGAEALRDAGEDRQPRARDVRQGEQERDRWALARLLSGEPWAARLVCLWGGQYDALRRCRC